LTIETVGSAKWQQNTTQPPAFDNTAHREKQIFRAAASLGKPQFETKKTHDIKEIIRKNPGYGQPKALATWRRKFCTS
jgi:hypothetical protein